MTDGWRLDHDASTLGPTWPDRPIRRGSVGEGIVLRGAERGLWYTSLIYVPLLIFPNCARLCVSMPPGGAAPDVFVLVERRWVHS